jgi:hypothetical protein
MIFSRMLELWARGAIDFDTDTFRVSLHTSAYTPVKDTHDFFDDTTNEVVGAGYTAGGNVATVSVNLNTTDDRLELTLGGTTWPASTITARQAVYRKARGGAASADELVAVNNFGSDVASVTGTFTLNASTIRITNPT